MEKRRRQRIKGSKKCQNGIQIFWSDAGNGLNDFFSHEELADQKNDALDLMENPQV